MSFCYFSMEVLTLSFYKSWILSYMTVWCYFTLLSYFYLSSTFMSMLFCHCSDVLLLFLPLLVRCATKVSFQNRSRTWRFWNRSNFHPRPENIRWGPKSDRDSFRYGFFLLLLHCKVRNKGWERPSAVSRNLCVRIVYHPSHCFFSFCLYSLDSPRECHKCCLTTSSSNLDYQVGRSDSVNIDIIEEEGCRSLCKLCVDEGRELVITSNLTCK